MEGLEADCQLVIALRQANVCWELARRLHLPSSEKQPVQLPDLGVLAQNSQRMGNPTSVKSRAWTANVAALLMTRVPLVNVDVVHQGLLLRLHTCTCRQLGVIVQGNGLINSSRLCLDRVG